MSLTTRVLLSTAFLNLRADGEPPAVHSTLKGIQCPNPGLQGWNVAVHVNRQRGKVAQGHCTEPCATAETRTVGPSQQGSRLRLAQFGCCAASYLSCFLEERAWLVILHGN